MERRADVEVSFRKAGLADASRPPRDERDVQRHPRLRWWKEVLYVLVFYGVYSAIRNNFGSAAVGADVAQRNAERIVEWERALGLYVEEAVQDLFLGAKWFIQFWNLYYGTFHFVVTVGVLVYLFRKVPGRYARWRNALAWTTGLALIGFATFPLMPPRLMPDSYGFVDTLAEIGGLWSFDSGAMSKVSNQYAAMPSLHIGWSTWCAVAMLPLLRRRWAQAAFALYPAVTLFAIVVTANHWWLDAVGGTAVATLGYLLGSAQEERRADRETKRLIKAGLRSASSVEDLGLHPRHRT